MFNCSIAARANETKHNFSGRYEAEPCRGTCPSVTRPSFATSPLRRFTGWARKPSWNAVLVANRTRWCSGKPRRRRFSSIVNSQPSSKSCVAKEWGSKESPSFCDFLQKRKNTLLLRTKLASFPCNSRWKSWVVSCSVFCCLIVVGFDDVLKKNIPFSWKHGQHHMWVSVCPVNPNLGWIFSDRLINWKRRLNRICVIF